MLLKVYKFKILLAMLVMPFLAFAQPPSGWEIPTPLSFQTHQILIADGLVLTVEGIPVQTGDWLGVFYLDAGNFVCGGHKQMAATGNNITAYGDLGGMFPGFSMGDEFIWKFFDSSTGQEYFTQASYLQPSGKFFTGSGSTLTGFTGAFMIAASATPPSLSGPGNVDLAAVNLNTTAYNVITWKWTDGVNDYTGQNVTAPVTATTTFTVTATTDASLTATASVLVTVSGLTAGGDAAICEDTTYLLSGAAASPNFVVLSWATTGNGTFSNPTIANPTYTPGTLDLPAVTLTLTGIDLVNGPQSASMILSVQGSPSIDIVPLQDFSCQGDPYTFADVVTEYVDSVQWFTTNGSGLFDNEKLLNPTYYSSPGDWSQTCIIIGVTAAPITPCAVSTEDFMDLCFVAPPTALAGDDQEFCSDAITEYTMDATVTLDATYGGNILWTGGLGYFDDASVEDAVYHFDAQELADGGTINFTLTATTPEACNPAYPCC